MKKIAIVQIIYILTLSNTLADSNKSFWGFGGFNLGLANIKSDVVDESGQKQGIQYGGQLSGLYSSDSWAVNSTLSWFQLDFESDHIRGRKTKLETRTFTIDIAPLWRPHHRWYFGPKFAHTFSDKILVGPGDNRTTDKLVGLSAYYEIPWKKYKIRSGLHAHHLLDIGDRSSQALLFTLEIGKLFFQNDRKVATSKVRFKEKATEKINLGDSIVNFKTGSSELTQKSRKFLTGLGSILRDIKNDWEILRIEGHTDVRGKASYNMKLSEDRVESVIAALINGGAPNDRISGEAFGETSPLYTEDTEFAHAKNRRVELSFIGETNKAKLKEIIEELLEQ